MVNRTCPMKYWCDLLIKRLKCDDCGWSEFDFTRVKLTEIQDTIAIDRARAMKEEVSND